MELRVEHLKKSYKKQDILKDISFAAYSGECIGFIGKNGCGKTTLLSILAGILKPDGGRVLIDGKVINNSFSYDKVIGFLPQTNPLPELLSVDDCLRLYCDSKDNYKYAVERYELSDMLKKSIAKLSGGMKRRVAIACAMANRPKIVILDEPTAALDIEYKRIIHNDMLDFIKQGGLILLVSHEKEEIELCSRYFFMEDGVLTNKSMF